MGNQNGYKVENFKLDRRGIGKILRSAEMMNALESNARNIGDGEIKHSFTGFDRAHVLVSTGEKINDN